jgi:hypothetical protein
MAKPAAKKIMESMQKNHLIPIVQCSEQQRLSPTRPDSYRDKTQLSLHFDGSYP